MNRKQKERMEKEKLRDEEDSKKSAQSNDLGKHFVPSFQLTHILSSPYVLAPIIVHHKRMFLP